MEATQASAENCSRWSGIPQAKLHDHNRLHIEILVRAFRTGVYNLPINWKSAEFWGNPKLTMVSMDDASRLCTFDADALTRLVILAHDECVRVSISPHTFKQVKVGMWSGRKREGGMSHRHPTIEQAIDDVRRQRAI